MFLGEECNLNSASFFCLVWWIYRQDKVEAIEILVSDLKKFSAYNAEVFKEITQLLTLRNFR